MMWAHFRAMLCLERAASTQECLWTATPTWRNIIYLGEVFCFGFFFFFLFQSSCFHPLKAILMQWQLGVGVTGSFLHQHIDRAKGLRQEACLFRAHTKRTDKSCALHVTHTAIHLEFWFDIWSLSFRVKCIISDLELRFWWDAIHCWNAKDFQGVYFVLQMLGKKKRMIIHVIIINFQCCICNLLSCLSQSHSGVVFLDLNEMCWNVMGTSVQTIQS